LGGGSGGGSDRGGANSAGADRDPAPLLIDDFEDLDGASEELEGHAGLWFTMVDKDGSTILPAPNTLFTAGTKNCHDGSKGCAIVSGTTVAGSEENAIYPFARFGVVLKYVTKLADKVFDASAYTGVRLWARGNVEVRFTVATADTTVVVDGGTCTASGECGNDHGLSVQLSSGWQRIELPFESLKQDPKWGAQVAFDKSKLLIFSVWFPADSDYAAAFGDVAFY
jgi:hypothetical protein